MIVSDEAAWSQQLFGSCELGDSRRTRRLVDMGARLARQVGASMAKCCEGESAALLGSYRLLRNDEVAPEAIREGGFGCVAREAQSRGVLLAVEDTTRVSYAHAAAAGLGSTGSQREAKYRGYLVHSVLLLDATDEHTVGLIEQRHWCRQAKDYGQKHARKRRAYEDKESFKWEQASVRMAERLGDAMRRTISVCDRESDIYEYLSYKLQHGHRFVLRAKSDRRVLQSTQSLFTTLEREAPVLCCYTVAVKQRGGRRARQAKLALRSLQVELQAPASQPKQAGALSVNVVLAQEIDPAPGEQALRWVLLTTEPVSRAEQATEVVRYYELRWRIEDYHKAWKSGVGVERQRLQSPQNLERMLVITAFLAVRLLQLREHLSPALEGDRDRACDTVLTDEEWSVLWLCSESGPRPACPPPLSWACLAVARLGGFADTKRTGRPGWDALWHGWARLQQRIEGYQLAQRMAAQM